MAPKRCGAEAGSRSALVLRQGRIWVSFRYRRCLAHSGMCQAEDAGPAARSDGGQGRKRRGWAKGFGCCTFLHDGLPSHSFVLSSGSGVQSATDSAQRLVAVSMQSIQGAHVQHTGALVAKVSRIAAFTARRVWKLPMPPTRWQGLWIKYGSSVRGHTGKLFNALLSLAGRRCTSCTCRRCGAKSQETTHGAGFWHGGSPPRGPQRPRSWATAQRPRQMMPRSPESFLPSMGPRPEQDKTGCALKLWPSGNGAWRGLGGCAASVGEWWRRSSEAANYVARPIVKGTSSKLALTASLKARLAIGPLHQMTSLCRFRSWPLRLWQRCGRSKSTQATSRGHHMATWCTLTCLGLAWRRCLWRRPYKACQRNWGERGRKPWPTCSSPRSHPTAALLGCTVPSSPSGAAPSSVERPGKGPQWNACPQTSWRPWA